MLQTTCNGSRQVNIQYQKVDLYHFLALLWILVVLYLVLLAEKLPSLLVLIPASIPRCFSLNFLLQSLFLATTFLKVCFSSSVSQYADIDVLIDFFALLASTLFLM